MVRNGNDPSRGKSNPERDLLIVAALGITAATVVAIDDSYNGMLAAKAAGLRCVVAPNQLTAQMNFAEADLVVASLASNLIFLFAPFARITICIHRLLHINFRKQLRHFT